MKLISQIIAVVLLGIIGGSVPGPVLTAVFTDVLNKGLKRSFIVVFKALIAEVLIAALVLLLFFSWNVPTIFFYIISIGGSIVLFLLAKQVWGIKEITGEKREIFSFPKLFLLTALNGTFWIFWITICVPMAFQLNQAVFGGYILFLLFFEIGWIIAVSILAYIFSKFRPLLLKKKLVSIVFKIFALLLIFFGLKLLWGSFIYFLE